MSGFSTASYQYRMDKFNVKTFLNKIYTFIGGKMLNILDKINYSPSTLQNDTKGMAKLI